MPSPFDDLTDLYEATIDWPKRLAHESPFYNDLFSSLNAARVLDAACGTGHHAAFFHSLGLTVEAADLSPAMIARARQRLPEGPRITYAVRSFDTPAPNPGSFDVTICVGNSLALAPDFPAVQRALAAMLASLRPGGQLVVQVLNLLRLPDGPSNWQKTLRSTLQGRDTLIHKGARRSGDRGYVDLLATDLSTTPPTLHADCVPFLLLTPESLQQAARAAGVTQVKLFGNYQRNPYNPKQSPDLILIATR